MDVIDQASQSEELVVNKSKFIGYTLVAQSRSGFLTQVHNIQKKNPGCNHIAFAYQIKTQSGVDSYFNDAGEPSGTAGKPLLNILEMKHITNSGLAVVRFYGGINLGTGGLARAYSKAGMMALSKTKLTPFVSLFYYNLTIKYNMLEIITNVIQKNDGIILDKDFGENVMLLIQLTKEGADEIVMHYPSVSINEREQPS
ncbi:YigZ family protein [Methylophilaceae bacterium]|uniref:Thymidylate synthase n=1 Tax=Methylophilales bacterium HTCC2181 TaxID=383631 RepID=A0P6L4_9PROT|nr:thymidylate synthase [Methylophilales bacterium HTCC2181]MBT3512910.1 YigZ family protein [Nitrosomonadales bacterium]MCH9842160.1 YigZ family protein [Betaproteobacteria bacterium]MDA7751445.1 YigZ family protein [Methylophilaceae bacterium]MBT5411056.1 YigZ family protein [Nitrosomonadales bacterium]